MLRIAFILFSLPLVWCQAQTILSFFSQDHALEELRSEDVQREKAIFRHLKRTDSCSPEVFRALAEVLKRRFSQGSAQELLNCKEDMAWRAEVFAWMHHRASLAPKVWEDTVIDALAKESRRNVPVLIWSLGALRRFAKLSPPAAMALAVRLLDAVPQHPQVTSLGEVVLNEAMDRADAPEKSLLLATQQESSLLSQSKAGSCRERVEPPWGEAPP